LQEEQEMEYIRDYFLCDGCQNKDFKRIYTFSLRFHGINFSDDLIYDRLTDEMYQCTTCNKIFTKDQIEEGLTAIKAKHKGKE
jgi:ribosomal protein L37AE/L43A